MILNPDHQPPQPASPGEQRLYSFLVHSKWATKLGDRDLVLETIKHVVDHLGIGSKADALLMELIVRFEDAKGIEDDDIPPDEIKHEREDFDTHP